MNKLPAIIIINLLFVFPSFAQTEEGSKNMKVEMTQDAHYADGDQALYTLLFNKVEYSEEAKAAKVSGEVMVSFWVETDSSLSKINVISDPGCGCAESLKKILSEIKYVPALVNGVPMRSKVILNVPVRAH